MELQVFKNSLVDDVDPDRIRGIGRRREEEREKE